MQNVDISKVYFYLELKFEFKSALLVAVMIIMINIRDLECLCLYWYYLKKYLIGPVLNGLASGRRVSEAITLHLKADAHVSDVAEDVNVNSFRPV